MTFLSGLSVFCQKDLFRNDLQVSPWSETFNRVRFFRFNNVEDCLSDAVSETTLVLDLILLSEATYADISMNLKNPLFSVSSFHPIQSEILYTLKLFFFSQSEWIKKSCGGCSKKKILPKPQWYFPGCHIKMIDCTNQLHTLTIKCHINEKKQQQKNKNTTNNHRDVCGLRGFGCVFEKAWKVVNHVLSTFDSSSNR